MKKTPSDEGVLIFDILDNIFYRAVQSFAKSVQCFCADGLSFFNTIECISRKTLLKNEVILCNVLFEQSFIERFVADHSHHRNYLTMLKWLTMPNILSIIAVGVLFMSNKSLTFQNVLKIIEQADDFQIREIMDAVERRYAVAYPQWDVFYAAVHKDPALRRKDLDDLVAYIEKELKWNEERKDSLG